MQDNSDRTLRFLEDLDAIRERSQILQDELYSALSSKLNKNIYILSVVTAIFMPLTFLSGLLGMNVAGIPGAHHAFAFGIVCLIALGIGVLELLIFKRLKWI
jgi:zinc transporter